MDTVRERVLKVDVPPWPIILLCPSVEGQSRDLADGWQRPDAPRAKLGRMAFQQIEIRLAVRPRGFHLVTREILAALPGLERVRAGFLQLFLQHTSASLTINENADPDVRADLERWLDRAVPEDAPYFAHTAEGPDDMPAHVKASLMGCAVMIPIRQGRLALGTWQGIYLGEHRSDASHRTILATIMGD
jgi:secondary thiamine-phosphate synthase enzyme